MPSALFNRAHAGQRVHRSANAADTLGDGPGIARIAADENFFQAADHGAGAECVGDDAIFHHCLNAQVAFNASYRIDDYSCHGFTTPSDLQRALPRSRSACVRWSPPRGPQLRPAWRARPLCRRCLPCSQCRILGTTAGADRTVRYPRSPLRCSQCIRGRTGWDSSCLRSTSPPSRRCR